MVMIIVIIAEVNRPNAVAKIRHSRRFRLLTSSLSHATSFFITEIWTSIFLRRMQFSLSGFSHLGSLRFSAKFSPKVVRGEEFKVFGLTGKFLKEG